MASRLSLVTSATVSRSQTVISDKRVWNGKIFIIWSGMGEKYWALRIQNACKNLNWKCWIEQDDEKWKGPAAEEAHKKIAETIHNEKPDCVISLKLPCIYSTENIPHYLAATGIVDTIFKQSFDDLPDNFMKPETKMLAFEGILHASPETKFLKSYFLRNQRIF